MELLGTHRTGWYAYCTGVQQNPLHSATRIIAGKIRYAPAPTVQLPHDHRIEAFARGYRLRRACPAFIFRTLGARLSPIVLGRHRRDNPVAGGVFWWPLLQHGAKSAHRSAARVSHKNGASRAFLLRASASAGLPEFQVPLALVQSEGDAVRAFQGDRFGAVIPNPEIVAFNIIVRDVLHDSAANAVTPALFGISGGERGLHRVNQAGRYEWLFYEDGVGVLCRNERRLDITGHE